LDSGETKEPDPARDGAMSGDTQLHAQPTAAIICSVM